MLVSVGVCCVCVKGGYDYTSAHVALDFLEATT